MNSDGFIMDIIAALNKQLSRQRIKNDLKTMDNSMFVKVISKLSISLSQRQLKKDLKQLNDLYLQIGADLKIDSALKKKLQGRIKTLQDSISDLQIGVSTKKSSDIAKAVTEVRNKGQRAADKTAISFNIEVKREKAIADLEYIAKKYSKLFSNASATQKYNNILDAAYGITDAKQLSNVRAQIAAFTSELKANDLASQSLGDKWKRLIDRAKDLFSAASVVTLIFSQVRQAISSFLQLDTAMTNLYKVQDQITSRDQFSGLLTKWNKLAQNLAVSTESLISSMEAWSKISFNLDKSEQLAEITSIFEKTAEISNEKATSTLISAAQAFTEIDDLGVDDYVKRVEAVGNKINAIGNKYAIDSEGISDALQNASAALKVAGNDLNETIALITATNKIYQSPEEGSNMLKVAAARLRGQVDVLEKMGEDAEGVSTDLTKIQQQVYELTGNKVNIFKDEDTLKSTYQMILEIGEVFDSLSDRSQADLLEVMFGKQRSSAGAALLLNYEELEKIKNDSINAANSMAEEYSKYMESAEAHITIFKEKLVETYSIFMSGDLIKYTADLGSGILDLVNSTDLLRHGILAVLSLNIGKGITSVGASIASTVKQMNTLGNALQQVKNLPVDKVLRKESLQELGEATKNLTEKNLKLLLSQKQLEDSDKIRILKAQDLSKEEAQLKLQKMGLLSTTKQQTVANVEEAATTGTLRNAMLSLKTTAKEAGVTIKGMFANNPIGMGFMLATTAISVFLTAISKANEKLKETRRANIDAATTASENAGKLRDLYNEYTRLASIQDKTTSEEEAFKTAVENITVALGNKAEVLKNLTAGTDEYTDALARATKEELQSQAVTATIGRKSAEEDLQGEIWSEWKGSRVSIDSNSKGKSLSDEAQKAVAIVSDSLKEFETINRTWKNISWDISSDDPTEALEFYNSLVEAREKLVLASEDDETLLDTEIYVDINNAINTMSESLDTYIEKLYEEEKLNYMAQNGIPSVTEEYKAMESALVSVAGSSVDLQERFKELLMADFSGLATNINDVGDAVGNVIGQTESIPATISSSIKQIATQLEPQFAKLGEAYKEIFKLDDNGKKKFSLDSIDNSMLEELRQTFAEIKEEVGVTFDASKLDSFFDTLTNGNATAGQVQQAFNDLATAYLYSTDTLEQLNSETADSIEKQLEAMGVQNAAEVVAEALTAKTEELIVAKEYLAQTGKDLASATEEERTAFILEQIEAGNCGEALALLQLKKILVDQSTITTADDCQNILDLATAANIGIIKLQQLQTLMDMITQRDSAVQRGDSRAVSELNRAIREFSDNVINNLNLEDIEVDFSGATKSASKSGKEAGDAYLDAFQKEYDHLKNMLNRGEISEAQYLSKLRALYTKYFKDRKKYLDEYKKYESEYLSGMLDLHNKALSGISTLLNRKISAANDAKDASISALEEEKEKAAEVYQSQIDDIEKEKDAIDDLIKEKNKKIDSLNEEIDAIERIAETRKKNIQLEKDQYNLEKMLNQRTSMVYKDGQFIWETDTSGVRDAREKVREDQEALRIDSLKNEISLIQKEIDLLEEKKDSLSEEQERIQKLMDESNKYYDNLIKQQEKMFDSMIKNMEQQKSKWEELAEIQEIAEAYSAIEQVFGELGYSVEDILNGSESAFEDFKSRYIAIMSDMNQNTSFQEGLEYASGVAKESFGSIVSDAHEAAQELSNTFSDGTFSQAITQGVSDGIVSAKQELDKMDQLGKDAGDGLINGWTEKVSLFIEATKQAAIDAVEAFAEGQDSHSPSEAYKSKASDAIDGLLLGIEENKQSFIDAVKALAEDGVLAFEEGFNFENSTLNSSFDGLKLLIESVTEALGIGTEGSVGGLLGALDQLSKFTFSEDSIVKQFNNLKTAIDSVTSAISGGSNESSGGESQGGSGSGKDSNSGGKGSEGGGNSLTNAITEMGNTASEVIGEPEAEGDGTVIGEFGSMKTAVNDVTTAIGGGESEGNNSSGSGDDGNLIESITDLGTTTEETLGEPGGDGVISKFEELKQPIQEADEHVNGISDGLAAIDGQEVECTIKVNIETTGGLPAFAEGTLGNMNLESGEYTAQYGKAFAEGTGKYKGLPHDEKNALVSEYGQTEMTVLPNGNTIITDEPTMMDLPKDTVIYNEDQTKQIMNNKVDAKVVKGYANGVTKYSDGTIIRPDGSVIEPYDPDKDTSGFAKLYKAWHGYYDNIDENVDEINKKLSHHLGMEHSQKMNEEVNRFINNSSSVVNNTRNQPVTVNQNVTINCPNVTNDSGAENIRNELSTLSLKALQVNW